ncbi:MAG TPA: spore germination protein [Acholeplasmataceae bacterium]|nr:spore germination protein [Acholeplasmataceae bacterium]
MKKSFFQALRILLAKPPKKKETKENEQHKKYTQSNSDTEKLVQMSEEPEVSYLNKPLYENIDDTIAYIKAIQGNCFDLVIRSIHLENVWGKQRIAIIYISGISDKNIIDESILHTITNNYRKISKPLNTNDSVFDFFNNFIMTLSSVRNTDEFGELIITLLNGDAIILVEGSQKCFLVDSKIKNERAIEAPKAQVSVKGGNEAFNESLSTNICLIRRRIRNSHFRIEKYILGKKSNTSVVVMYIKGVADEGLVEEVKTRIEGIDVENILDSEYVSFYLREKQWTMFQTIFSTERPDSVVASLFEGRVAILVDGSPFALVAPMLFVQGLQSLEDYYMKGYIASFVRFTRIVAFFLGLYLPAIYISLIYFHSELLPINLLLSIAGQRYAIPFPGFLEILLIMFFFDLLRESGTRMPTSLGSSLSFLGAIIIGESAVQAGLFSSIIVIVVTITAICSLTIPDYFLNLTLTVLRYFFWGAAVIGGFYGVTLASIALLTHLCSLRSFGFNYLSPYTPFCASGMQDSVIRTRIDKIFRRKKNISAEYPH